MAHLLREGQQGCSRDGTGCTNSFEKPLPYMVDIRKAPFLLVVDHMPVNPKTRGLYIYMYLFVYTLIPKV